MLTYNCSVCKGSYSNQTAWLHHLIQEGHQQPAREGLRHWKEETVRNRVLIVFGKHPVGRDLQIVQKLSMFLIQPDQLCEVKEGEKVDWRALLSECGALLEQTSGGGGGNRLEVQEHPPIVLELEEPTSPPKQIKLMDTVNVEREVPEEVTLDLASNGVTPTLTAPTPPTSSDSDGQRLGLRHHLSSIRSLIEIPDQEHNMALDISRSLQEALIQDRKEGEPLLRTFLCRHWILKLKYSVSIQTQKLDNVGCALAIYRDPSTNPSFKMEELVAQTRRIFEYVESRKHFPLWRVAEVQHDPSVGVGKPSKRRQILRYRFEQEERSDPPTPPFWMTILFKQTFPVEAQVWNLAKHLCTFDPHCYPVLAVVYYWSQINNIRVGKSYDEGNAMNLGDPCALNWLLIFYFQMEGLIPSTKEVLERPHEPLHYMDVDIGFSEDNSWWMQGRNLSSDTSTSTDDDEETFAVKVFTLLLRFFLFCDAQFRGWSPSGEESSWILNTRDTEKLSFYDIMCGTLANSKLTSDEREAIRKGFEDSDYEPDRFILLHPLFVNWKISGSNAEVAFVAMRTTGLRLKDFLRKEENVKREKLEFEEFLCLLKI